MTEKPARTVSLRLSFQVAVFLGSLAAVGAVLLLVVGAWNKFVNETARPLMDWPGGSWVVGAGFGLITLLGWQGGTRLAPGGRSGTETGRAVRASGSVLCWLLAIGMGIYLFSALPGRHCSSNGPSCEYIPGTTSALISYTITVGVLGWILYRWGSTRAEERGARQRERVRKLRKRGRGKSRAARRP